MRVKDWFNCVLNNSIIAWKCACLPKKYIYKEHVKLLLQTDPLRLRKEFDLQRKKVFSELDELFNSGNTLTAQKELFGLIEYLVFANQIIENHKIVNFKKLGSYYKSMIDGQITDPDTIKGTYEALSYDELLAFKKNTDSILRASKIKKILQS